jgi:uncharacterized membrane protein (UPF0127 family)
MTTKLFTVYITAIIILSATMIVTAFMPSNMSVQKVSAQMMTQQSPSRGTMGSGADYNKPLPNYLKANITINGFNLIADVPTTNEGFQKGLGVKDHLNENEGMLFVFLKPPPPPFWMHGMKFPIDIIWLNGEGTVVHIEHNLQPCTPGLMCPTYAPRSSSGSSVYVLETVAGFSQKHNVSIGTSVESHLIT